MDVTSSPIKDHIWINDPGDNLPGGVRDSPGQWWGLRKNNKNVGFRTGNSKNVRTQERLLVEKCEKCIYILKR